jgi:phosphatidylserine/phosphatidylglycerophosphate/cardiolipin synthase-like enzyme/outer membrane protein OmpA-like peptidoglycan-associated protein
VKGLFAFEAEPFEFEAYGGSESEFTFRAEPFPWPPESEWEDETSRSSPDYIRWLQSSLNRVMGLRLAVDGILGPVTRSAVRNFQQRKGLAVDGIVGRKTEAALVAAGAPRPPASISATATGGGSLPNIPKQCSAVSRTNCHVLYFGFDKDVPTPPVPNRPARTDRDAHEDKLFEIAERVVHSWETSQPVNSLLVLGHASFEGPDVYNYDLAMRRAENVSEALAEQVEELEPGGGSRIDLQVESCGEKLIGGLSVEDQRQVEVCFQPPPRWFETGGRPPTRMQPVWLGNDVRFFIDAGPAGPAGPTTFEEMVKAIKTAKSLGHYIYLLGWFLNDDFELIPGDPDSKIRRLFAEASTKGVQIRAMLWDHTSICPKLDEHVQNTGEVLHINDWLSTGAAVLDSRTLSVGSHHQKILIVKGAEGLIAFCGGVDINPDRILQTGSTRGAPFHDVHCRVKGPAAHELLKIFVERWKDHMARLSKEDRELFEKKIAEKLRNRRPPLDPVKYCPLLGLNERRPAWEGDMYVQIGRTYGNGGGYQFASGGEQTAYRMILKAIREARRFIYIEDQYLVSMEISSELEKALQNNRDLKIIILVPHGSITNMAAFSCQAELGEQVHFRRQQFITPLRAAARSRVGVFFLSPPGARNTYVHSKMMVVDDEYAIIGSANLGRRSLTHDSEAIAGIYDPSPDSMAKRLRVALWARHLGMVPSALADGVASVKYWFPSPAGARPATARVADYDENRDVEAIHPQWAWDKIDPDGS